MKMGLESILTEVEAGYTWPGTQIQRFVIPQEDLKKYGLQRKRGDDVPHYSIWMLAIGETGGNLTYFYGHRLLDAAKQAKEWKASATQPQKQSA